MYNSKKIEKSNFLLDDITKNLGLFHSLKRKTWNIAIGVIVWSCSLLLIFVVLTIFLYILINGLHHFRFHLFFQNFSQTQLDKKSYTGIAGPIISTLLLLTITLTFATPIALFAAIYVSVFLKKQWIKKSIVNFMITCNSIPSIIFGIFGSILFIQVIRFVPEGFCILAAGFTVGLLILPVLFLGLYESINSINKITFLNSYVLGASKTYTIINLIIPYTLKNIKNTLFFCITRIVGESAPILFTIGSSNFIPHSSLDPGNSLTLLLYALYKNTASSGFIFFITIAIFIVILVFYFIINLIIFLIMKIFYDINTFNIKNMALIIKNWVLNIKTYKYKLLCTFFNIYNEITSI